MMSYVLKIEPSQGGGGETDKRETFTHSAKLPTKGNSVNITLNAPKFATQHVQLKKKIGKGEETQAALL
jgi:hypothetical protein